MLRRSVPPTSEKVMVSPFLLMRISSTGSVRFVLVGNRRHKLHHIDKSEKRHQPKACDRWGGQTNEAAGRLDIEELSRFYPIEKCCLPRTA